MLTRDIGLKTSILDLCDNAIDQAVRQDGVDAMGLLLADRGTAPRRFVNRNISIEFGPDSFRIRDTCGGISVDDARRRVFLFGDPDPAHFAGHGLSVYGIGMKRALFKIGNKIRIASATEQDWFELEIDVAQWKSQHPQDWKFRLTRSGGGDRPADFRVAAGQTEIEVTALRDTVGPRFAQPPFVRQLRSRMANSYALFLMAGLEIEVCGLRVASSLPEVGVSDMLQAARHERSLGSVDVLLIAGITPRASVLPGGWCIFCNGRMILDHDTTHLTGWGEALPRWHSKYQHFVGYVYLRGPVQSLPWTTTKGSLVFDSEVYQSTLGEMVIQARPILAFLDSAFPGDLIPETAAGRTALDSVPLQVSEIPKKELPFAAPGDLAIEDVEIRYAKPAADLYKIREHVDEDLSAAQIGALTFDYYIRQECE